MKIVYSAGKQAGAKYQLADFLRYNCHDIRVAAYNAANETTRNFQWTLDGFPNLEYKARLRQDIIDYAPDFAIIDNEFIVADIVASLKIPIVYCSSIHLLNGIAWHRKTHTATASIERRRKELGKFPPGIINCVYGPYELTLPLAVKHNFEWIYPYANKTATSTNEVAVVVDNVVRVEKLQAQLAGLPITFCKRNDDCYTRAGTIISDGSVSVITDALTSQKKLIVIPDLTDPDCTLNSSVISLTGLGKNLGQLELMGRLGRDDLVECIEDETEHALLPMPPLHCKKLHERMDEL